MLFLDKENYYKITKAIYYQNDGDLVFNCCEHFSWDHREQHAEELIAEDEDGVCFCTCCGEKLPKKSMKNIAKLVKYLNNSGRDDEIMTKLYKDVDLYEWAVISPGRIVDNYANCNFSVSNLERSFGFYDYPVLIDNESEA